MAMGNKSNQEPTTNDQGQQMEFYGQREQMTQNQSLSDDNQALANQLELTSTNVHLNQRPAAKRRQAPMAAASTSSTSGELSLPGQQAAAAAAAYALAQEGRKAADKLNAELCRNFSIGIQHETGGIFTSPNYPNAYPANLICTKLIEAPSGYFVVLEFRDQFNIEEAGTDCDNDKIEIRDGRFGYSKVLARYCGTRFPPEVRSSDEAMWLRFISDSSITHNGFKAVYRFERQKNTKPLPPFECRFNVTSPLPQLTHQSGSTALVTMAPNSSTTDGSSSSNNNNRTSIHSGIIKNTDVPERLIEYSKQYNVSLECIWNITVTPGWKIYLTFSSYEINRPNDCDSNFIEIYEENLTEENQTVKFCGTRTEPQQSRSNVFNIRHHAVPAASGSRFEIIYTAFREKGPAGCDTREFDCDDGTCIHESLKCDGTVNCKYRYDEASEPGPCAIGEDVQPFFETEHMVIILIVFLALVTGMCASIVISCWGKIQERRRRKLEYHMRKSREASMEGQLNKVDQLVYSGSQDSAANGKPRPPDGSMGAKMRLSAAVGPSENHIHQQHLFNNQLSAYGQQQAMAENQQRLVQPLLDHSEQQQHQLEQQQLLFKQHMYRQQQQSIGASNPSLRMMAGEQQQQQQQQERSLSVYGSRPKVSDHQTFQSQLVPGSRSLLISRQQTSASEAGHQQLLEQSIDCTDAERQQHLNSLVRKQQQQLQHVKQQQYIASTLYGTQQTDSQDSSSQAPIIATQGGRQTVGYLPASMFKQSLDQQQQLMFDTQQQQQRRQQFLNNNNSIYQQQRALTLSAMHRPQTNANFNSMTMDSNAALFRQHQQQQQQQQMLNRGHIYGFQQPNLANQANLSNSITCCNSLGAEYQTNQETPLIGDLIKRANAKRQVPLRQQIHMQQQQQQQPQQTSTIPRSISAYQLSRAQSNLCNHQLMQQQQQQQIIANQGAQFAHKSMSDAGHVQKLHQPPNHSLSYPHACTGDHPGQTTGESPGLPPPPPPPNLMQSRPVGGGPTQQQQLDHKRSAFQVSRLNPSQLTSDTLPDSDLMLANMPALGSMQSDELSTESDATFGMLVDSVGNGPLSAGPGQVPQQQRFHPLVLGAHGVCSKGQMMPVPAQAQQLMVQQAAQFNHQQQQPVPPTLSNCITHLSDCNLVRRQQRTDALSSSSTSGIGSNGRPLLNQQQQQQSMICDCGAVEQAQQMRQRVVMMNQQPRQPVNMMQVAANQQQHRQLLQSSDTRDFDLGDEESEELKAMPYGYANDIQQTNRFNRFRQQSSELTGDDDDEEEEEEQVGEDEDDDEVLDDEDLEVDQVCRRLAASTNLNSRNAQQLPLEGNYGERVIRRHNAEEPLRDETSSSLIKQQRGQLGGSHGSLSQHSCTCGSQSKLNQSGVENGEREDEEDDGEEEEGIEVDRNAITKQNGHNNTNSSGSQANTVIVTQTISNLMNSNVENCDNTTEARPVGDITTTT